MLPNIYGNWQTTLSVTKIGPKTLKQTTYNTRFDKTLTKNTNDMKPGVREIKQVVKVI